MRYKGQGFLKSKPLPYYHLYFYNPVTFSLSEFNLNFN